MKRDFKDTVEEVRAHSDIVEVISSRIELKRAGAAFKACCPFHNERTPSFHVNPQRQIFHCFGCGTGGDVFRFIMEFEKTDFMGALRMLAERSNIEIDFDRGESSGNRNRKTRLLELHELAAAFYRDTLLKAPEADGARDYLAGRRLSPEITDLFQIGYAPDSWDALLNHARSKGFQETELTDAGLLSSSEKSNRRYDRFRARLMFPIRNEAGRVIGFSGRTLEKDFQGGKYVNSPETLLFHKSRILFALDQARKAIAESRSALIVEGQIDAIRCHEAGICNTVASQGTALTPDHARIIKRYADEVVLILDADPAGENAALKSIDAFVAAGLAVRVATLPEGEDPDSLIRDRGRAAFESAIESALPAIDFQLDTLSRRENIETQAGLLRVSQIIRKTLACCPTAVIRDRMLQRAAERLKVSPAALYEDVHTVQQQEARKPLSTARRNSTGEKRRDAAPPREESGLLEHLIQFHKDLLPLISDYLLPHDFKNPDCRLLYEKLLSNTPEELMSELAMLPESTQNLASRLQLAARAISDEVKPDEVARDYILVLIRNRLEQERESLDSGQIIRRVEITRLLTLIRKGWDAAAPHLEPLH